MNQAFVDTVFACDVTQYNYLNIVHNWVKDRLIWEILINWAKLHIFFPTFQNVATIFTSFYCRCETESGRIREARARQIVRAEKPQAQDARATKQARPETKKQEGSRVKIRLS